MLSFTIIIDLIILLLSISGKLINPDLIFTLLAISFGVGFTGTIMMNFFYKGIAKKHNLNTFTRIILDVITHIIPMWYMYHISKYISLDNNKIIIYIIISLILPILYSMLIDNNKVYPEVPIKLFYITYPISILIPFFLRSINFMVHK